MGGLLIACWAVCVGLGCGSWCSGLLLCFGLMLFLLWLRYCAASCLGGLYLDFVNSVGVVLYFIMYVYN